MKKKTRGAEYFKECAKAMLEHQSRKNGGVLTMKSLEKIFEEVDRKMGLKSSSKRSRSKSYKLKDDLRELCGDYWQEQWINVKKMGLDDQEKVRSLKGLSLNCTPEQVVERINARFKKEKEVAQKKSTPDIAPVPSTEEKRFRDYVIERALKIEDKREGQQASPEAIKLVKEELQHPIKKDTWKLFWKILWTVKQKSEHRILLSEIAKVIGWKAFSVQNLTDMIRSFKKYEIDIKYRIPNQSGHGRKNVYFDDLENVTKAFKLTVTKLYGEKLLQDAIVEMKPNQSQAMKEVEEQKVQEEVRDDREKYIIFACAGILYYYHHSMNVDDMVKILHDSTYIRYDGGNRELVKILRSAPGIFDVSHSRTIWISKNSSFRAAIENYSPYEMRKKLTLVSGSGLKLEKIKEYFENVYSEYSMNGVEVFTIYINKSYHDLLNVLDLYKVLRAEDKIIADNKFLGMIEKHLKIEKGRRMTRQTRDTVCYNADLILYEWETTAAK